MRISDWSSDVCSSDLTIPAHRPQDHITLEMAPLEIRHRSVRPISAKHAQASRFLQQSRQARPWCLQPGIRGEGAMRRSEEHTSELQSLMRISYAVFCLKKKKKRTQKKHTNEHKEQQMTETTAQVNTSKTPEYY